MLLLQNVVRAYAWGTVDGMASLVGSDPTGGPEAELWVGSHPGAPSLVAGDPDGRTLAQVIADDPARWLGDDLAAAGHTSLPFLLKILAIGLPLSLQAHPSAEQASAGFAREEAAGPARDAPDRTYRDPNPKPEALVALRETWALCGFRQPVEAANLIDGLGIEALRPIVDVLAKAGDEALPAALGWLLRLDRSSRSALAVAVTDALTRISGEDPEDPRTWVRRLTEVFPGDPLAVAPLLLNLVRLLPGEAVHLPAGNLHAYLGGAGVEIMAASDNVLRGGLTPKYVDVDELLEVLVFRPGVPARPSLATPDPQTATYDAGEQAFLLSRIQPAAGPIAIDVLHPSLLLATDGSVDLAGPEGGVTLDHGAAAFAAPGEGPITVSGSGTLWWATTGRATT